MQEFLRLNMEIETREENKMEDKEKQYTKNEKDDGLHSGTKYPKTT